jgi:hypothetical protein
MSSTTNRPRRLEIVKKGKTPEGKEWVVVKVPLSWGTGGRYKLFTKIIK